MVKIGSCSLGAARVHLLAQAGAMEMTLIMAPKSALKTARHRGSLLVRKRTEKN